MGLVLVVVWVAVWFFTVNEQAFEYMKRRSRMLQETQLKMTCMVLLGFGVTLLGHDLIWGTSKDAWGQYFTQGAIFLLVQCTYAFIAVGVYRRLENRGEYLRTVVTGWTVFIYAWLMLMLGVVPFL